MTASTMDCYRYRCERARFHGAVGRLLWSASDVLRSSWPRIAGYAQRASARHYASARHNAERAMEWI